MSDSVRPHRRQPTRLPRPLDSPGKNTGVHCHFLLQCMKVKSESEVAQSCPTLSDPMDCSPPGSSVHGILQARGLEWAAIAFSCHHSKCHYLFSLLWVLMSYWCQRFHYLLKGHIFFYKYHFDSSDLWTIYYPSIWAWGQFPDICVLSCFSRVWLCANPWTVACQAPLSMGFSRQEHWSGLPFPSPEDLPAPGIEPASLTSPSLAGGFFTASATSRCIWRCNWLALCHSPLEKSMATHSSICAWRMPWTGEPGGLQSMGLQRITQDWSDLASKQAMSHFRTALWYTAWLYSVGLWGFMWHLW